MIKLFDNFNIYVISEFDSNDHIVSSDCFFLPFGTYFNMLLLARHVVLGNMS